MENPSDFNLLKTKLAKDFLSHSQLCITLVREVEVYEYVFKDLCNSPLPVTYSGLGEDIPCPYVVFFFLFFFIPESDLAPLGALPSHVYLPAQIWGGVTRSPEPSTCLSGADLTYCSLSDSHIFIPEPQITHLHMFSKPKCNCFDFFYLHACWLQGNLK